VTKRRLVTKEESQQKKFSDDHDGQGHWRSFRMSGDIPQYARRSHFTMLQKRGKRKMANTTCKVSATPDEQPSPAIHPPPPFLMPASHVNTDDTPHDTPPLRSSPLFNEFDVEFDSEDCYFDSAENNSETVVVQCGPDRRPEKKLKVSVFCFLLFR